MFQGRRRRPAWHGACSFSHWNSTVQMATQTIVRMSEPAFVYGQGPDLQSLNVLAAEIAATDIPVLLVGESGTGKGIYARLIHRLSGAPERSFIRVNCGLDPSQMLNDVREAFSEKEESDE